MQLIVRSPLRPEVNRSHLRQEQEQKIVSLALMTLASYESLMET